MAQPVNLNTDIWKLLTNFDGPPMSSVPMRSTEDLALLFAGEDSPIVQPKNQKAIAEAEDALNSNVMSFDDTMARNFPMNSEQQFEEAFMKSMANREASNFDLEEKLKAQMEAKPTGFQAANLKPLLAFADQLTGSRTASGYENDSMTDWQAQTNKLQESLLREKGSLSDDQLNYLKAKAQEEATDKRLARSLAAAGTKATNRNVDLEDRYYKQYQGDKIYKNMGLIQEAAQRAVANPGTTGADQEEFLVEFNKLLDPGSVVRETEFMRSARNSGLLKYWLNTANRIKTGKYLEPQQYREMQEVVKRIYEASRKQMDDYNKKVSERVKSRGLDPEMVVIDPYERLDFGGSPESTKPAVKELSDEEILAMPEEQYKAWKAGRGK